MITSVQCNDMEFMAEHELISIIPYFELKENEGKLNCISGDFGPFHPSIPTQVPLWLAISLKQLQKCRILQPSWMSVPYLKQQLAIETKEVRFAPLPYHYMEISALLIKHAGEDIEQLETLRLVLEDIQQLRQEKIRSGLIKIAADFQRGGSANAVQLDNVGAMEINSIRQIMTKSLMNFHCIDTADTAATSGSNEQSQDYSQGSSYGPSPNVSRALRRHR